MLSPYKFAITLCFLTLTICDPVPNEPSEDPIRHTSKGNVKGTEITTRQGNSAWIFYGVPYASRPQRFLKPRPLTKWSGTKDCKVAKPDCIGDYTGGPQGSSFWYLAEAMYKLLSKMAKFAKTVRFRIDGIFLKNVTVFFVPWILVLLC